jgi:hypothetical protein
MRILLILLRINFFSSRVPGAAAARFVAFFEPMDTHLGL